MYVQHQAIIVGLALGSEECFGGRERLYGEARRPEQ
jgi:hypothetical protein